MDSTTLAADEAAALELIRKANGLTGGAAMWMFWGGAFDAGKTPTGTITITYAQVLKGYKLPSRLSALVKRGHLRRGHAAYNTSGAGFYPLSASPTVAAQVVGEQRRVPVKAIKKASSATRDASFADAMAALQ